MDMMVAEEAQRADDLEPVLTGKDDTGEGSSESDHQFKRAIAVWRSIGLSELVAKLDATASDIVAYQRDSLAQRKDVAQKTKDFRKLDDPGKLSEYKGLLKAYQAFIDVLTNQGKTSSSAFLQLYSSLSEAPDPYPLLEASVESLVVSEETLPRLTDERDSLRTRLDKVSAQLEDTEKRLSEERSIRSQAEQAHSDHNRDLESSWAKVLQEKQENWEAREKGLDDKIENQDRLLKEFKANLEVSQRLDQNGESTSSTTLTELEMANQDLEKTSLRLADMEARNEQLRTDLARAVSQARAERITVQDDPAFKTLQSENSALMRKLESVRLDKDGERRDWEKRIQQVGRHKTQLSSEITELKAKVNKWSDYEDLRRELEMIRSIEFSTGDDDDQPTMVNGSAKDTKSLEQLMMSRNKKLSSEMTVLRVSHQTLQKQHEDLQTKMSKTNADLEKSQNLAAALENDLLKVQESSNPFPSGASTVGSLRAPVSSRRGRASPTSSIISGFDTSSRTGTTLEALRSGEPVGGGSGILPMVQAQRDRFKQKNTQLEEELSKTYSTVTSLRQEVASLQKDNLSLYEKTRFVSTYNRGPSTSSTSSAYGQGPAHTAIQISPTASPAMDKYKSQYESNISPFAAFRGREATRAYKRMSLPERAVYSVIRIVLATRTSRNLFAVYCLSLHVLVLIMLYWSGSEDAPKHHASLGTAAVVAAAAGGSAGDKISGKEWQADDFHAS